MNLKEKYLHWIKYSDPDTASELLALKDDDNEIYERFYKALEFATAGMRGLIGAGPNRINRYTVAKATKGLAEYIKAAGEAAMKKGVAIAHDNRRKSREFAEVTAGVLAANGIKCYLFEDLRTTPELSYTVRRLACFSRVLVTASHNPPEYNGYKIYDDTGCQFVPDTAQLVIDEIEKIEDELKTEVMPINKAGELIEIIGKEIDEPYYEEVLALRFDKNTDKNIKVIYTPQHGTGNIPVRYVLDKAGFDVTPVEAQCVPDTEFSATKNPNPEAKEAYDLAIELMKEKQADIAIATDPDCDRLGAVISHKGEYTLLTGNQSGAIILYYILSRMKEQGTLPKNGIMFNTVVTSTLGDKIAESFGVETEKTLTGFKFIGDKIKQHERTDGKKFVFGYEESYGCLIGDFVRDKDAVQASLMFCEAADYYKKQGKTLIDVLNEIYEKYGYFADNLVSVTLKGAEGAKQIAKIMDDLRANKPDSIAGYPIKEVVDFTAPPEGFISSNVLLYNFADGSFAAVRPSGTEPKCKFYYCICAENKDAAEAKMAAVKEYFKVES